MHFFFIIITVTVVVYFYLGVRLIVPSHFSKRKKILLWIVHFVLFFLPILGFVFRIFNVGDSWLDIFSWIAYISLGFFSILFALLLFYDCCRLVAALIRFFVTHLHLSRDTKRELAEAAADDGHKQAVMSRRRFITNSVNIGLVGLSVLMTLGGIKQALTVPQVVRVVVPIEGLPQQLNGLRIAQISDIHIGPTIKRDSVQNVVDRVNALNCDMIAITGDLVDGSVGQLHKDAAPLSQLKARYGVFFVTGNHEYYSGVFSWIKHIRSMGIRVLINEHEVITVKNEAIVVAGVTDYNAGRVVSSHQTSPREALHNAPKDAIKILFAHQPSSVFEAAALNYDLVICGHTHGGQYFPWNLLVSLVQPYLKGLHKHEGTWIYVNRGTGYWGPPLRLGVPPEITELTLTCKP